MNNNEFKLEGFASWDLPVYLHRQNPVPLDETSVFTSFESAQQYASDEDGMAYPGQIISVVTGSEVKVYKINNGKLEELGKGSLVTDQNPKELATTDNVGQIIYLTKDVKVTEGSSEVTYSSGPYIVSGAGEVSKIGTTSASGDIAADVAALQGRVSTLESTIGNDSTGLVKDVEDLKSKDTELAGQINTLSENVNKIKVEKLNTPESKSFAATYKFTDAAGNTVNINIPKDQFLKGVTYVEKAPEVQEGNSERTTFPALRFEWQLSEQAVTYVSVKSLIDNYGIKKGELYLKKDESNNFYIDFDALKAAIIGSETDPNSVLSKIKDATNKADNAVNKAEAASTAATEAKADATEAKTTAGQAKTAADTAASAATTAVETANAAKTDAENATKIANTAKTTADDAKKAADANTKTLEGHTTSITDLESRVTTNTSNIATNAGNITKNTNAIAANTTAINKNTEAIGTQAVVTSATIHIVGKPEQPVVPEGSPEGSTATAEYFLADGAGKQLTEADIKEGGIYYIYKRETIKIPDESKPGGFDTRITTSLVRQATSGAEGDITYPTTSHEATGLYQYIDNHIKNFDLSWQILD